MSSALSGEPMIAHAMQRTFVESAAGLRDVGRWGTLAWIDISLRYRRTMLGPFWLTLSTGAMIGSVGLLWGAIFGSPWESFLPYFAVGIVVWTLISGTLTEGCSVFINAGPIIKSMPTPLLVHVHRMFARHLIILAHNAILILLLWAIIRWPLGWSILLAIPGLIIVVCTVLGGVLALSIVCTRFADIPQIVFAVLQLLFLLTPIIWMPDSVRGKAVSLLVDFNPLYYMIEIVRGPLLGHPPAAYVWLVVVAFALAMLLVGHALYGRFRNRVAYWL